MQGWAFPDSVARLMNSDLPLVVSVQPSPSVSMVVSLPMFVSLIVSFTFFPALIESESNPSSPPFEPSRTTFSPSAIVISPDENHAI